jgi:hypothetical protein
LFEKKIHQTESGDGQVLERDFGEIESLYLDEIIEIPILYHLELFFVFSR